ncbi:hypothetical protein DD238_005485 [Peronospora effusa]|uniref:Uncharacterized protein n=1 Tax=Peronospora effusa TaxID=542832 RepID=A0A3M6VDR4_9STRA|nr:hypothetical protein DD238_005485 [Peronospora effusa]
MSSSTTFVFHNTDFAGHPLFGSPLNIASLPIGYNHPKILEAVSNKDNLAMFAQRPCCLGVFPPADWADRINDTLLEVAPRGLENVNT